MVAAAAGPVYQVTADSVAFTLASGTALTEGFTPNHIKVSTNRNANLGYKSITVEATILGTGSIKTWEVAKKSGTSDILPTWLTNVLIRSAVSVVEPANKVLRKL